MKRITCILIYLTTGVALFGRMPDGSLNTNAEIIMRDTIPDMCTVLPGREIDTMMIFTNPLTKTFPDPNPFENYWACYYQFYKPGDHPQLAVRMIKWGSKQEAADDFRNQVESATRIGGFAPQRLFGIADSAYFSFDSESVLFCDECGLVAIQGSYSIYISFKGQSQTVTRDGKILSALRLLQMMYDRIPGLAPSRIRDRTGGQ